MLKATIFAAASTAILTISSVAASAYVACVPLGLVCWHAKERYTYPAESKVVIHDDSWKWAPAEKYSWREHEGRGYWRDNAWVEFHD
jgi:hypothetical protein